MSETNSDHERRISTIEGEMKSVATKADLAELKHALTQSFQAPIQAQTNVLQKALQRHSDEIRELREKDSRIKGAIDTIKVALPFIISVIAVLVAIFK